jgi:flavin reductase (DIM6/NTAB) family NADH-FMN oxidoreductase RutF
MSPPRQAQPPTFSPKEFRSALGMFATGVTIVTAVTAEGQPIGLTASSFNSVSIDPPLVLWSLARAAGSLQAFSAGSHYAINILSAEQKDLAERFAQRRHAAAVPRRPLLHRAADLKPGRPRHSTSQRELVVEAVTGIQRRFGLQRHAALAQHVPVHP